MVLPLYGNPFNPVVVVSGLLAVPNRRYSYPQYHPTPICYFCQQGVVDTSRDLELPCCLLTQQARDEAFYDSCSLWWCFGYCLISGGKTASEGRSESLRSDLTLLLCSSSC